MMVNRGSAMVCPTVAGPFSWWVSRFSFLVMMSSVSSFYGGGPNHNRNSSNNNKATGPNVVAAFGGGAAARRRPSTIARLLSGDGDASTTTTTTTTTKKRALLDLLDTVPRNAATPRALTEKILSRVRDLEAECPTNDDEVLSRIAGNWDLLWTAQDASDEQSRRPWLMSWINPLENQSYSNNPTSGRADPILPREVQDRLEAWGVLAPNDDDDDGAPVRSTQAIDAQRRRVRNVVRVRSRWLGGRLLEGSLVVDVGFRPNRNDPRRVDVRFESCRLRSVAPGAIDLTVPLGPIGPTGWLRTGYVDDDVRITRGHKGSVFVLSRTSRTKRRPKDDATTEQ